MAASEGFLPILRERFPQGVWLTIGTFDGVHKGHQALINCLVQEAHAAGLPAVVLTFHPRPAEVLRGAPEANYLTHPDERVHLLKGLGVDEVVIHPFDRQVAALSAYEFISRLKERLDLRHLLVGLDFALGRGREGNVPRLQELGASLGFTVEEFPLFNLQGEVISSSRIRQALNEGEMQQAAWMLGRPYHLTGTVVHGDGRGRKIDVPTANLDIWPGRLIPQVGVYACWVRLQSQFFPAVTNIGFRPTFEEQVATARVETHLLDFRQNLYDETLAVYFTARLRAEQRFSGVEALLEQIQRDIAHTRQVLNHPPDAIF